MQVENDKGMVPNPKVLAFLLCHDVIHDAGSKQKTLVNITDQINAPSYPAMCPNLKIFAQMTAGHGTKNIEIKVVFASTNEPIGGGASGSVTFESPLQVIDLIVPISGLILPKAGEYRLQFVSDGILEVEQRLKAAQFKASPLYWFSVNWSFGRWVFVTGRPSPGVWIGKDSRLRREGFIAWVPIPKGV